MKTDCPKCGSDSAWYSRTNTDLVVRCTCGFHKVVFTTLGSAVIANIESGTEVKLPKRDTNLYRTLVCVSILMEPSSAEVTERLRDMKRLHSVSDVSSYLTILRSKGLVDVVVNGRGSVGGSTWRLTDKAEDLLNI